MQLKKNLKIFTSDFWYDLTDGGYLNPEKICKCVDDAKRVKDAIEVIEDFRNSCEKQIENFIR